MRENRDTLIIKPDKRNGLVGMDRDTYDRGILNIISDTSKCRILDNEGRVQRKGKLQRFVGARKNRVHLHLDNITSDNIYPFRSQPARIYGLPKMHKSEWSPQWVRKITFYLSIYSIFWSLIFQLPTMLATWFLLYRKSTRRNFNMVPFDIESLFTNIRLDECIELAVKCIYQSNPGLTVSHGGLQFY